MYTHAQVLDIIKRQKSLNHRPGDYFSYTNSGYNLLTLLVERVSGKSFADFTRERYFGPLGMTRTQWRDDHTRVVENRALAYRPAAGGLRLNMLWDNVHGTGGLLTTVGDLLTWTENLRTGRIGGPAWAGAMRRTGRLNSGRQIEYAGGIYVSRYRGLPEISHSGATGGYRAFAAHYPEHGLGVVVLCNIATSSPTELAHQIVNLHLGSALAAAPEDSPVVGVPVPSEKLAALAGTYREARTHEPTRVLWEGGFLRLQGGPRLVPLSPTSFVLPDMNTRIEFTASALGGERRPAFVRIAEDGDSVRYELVEEWTPTAADLSAFAGQYRSEEAETTYTISARGGMLVLRPRLGRAQPLNPVFTNAFRGPVGTVRFHRDKTGRVTAMSVSTERVWDLRFAREP